jgi:hypothetical protein
VRPENNSYLRTVLDPAKKYETFAGLSYNTRCLGTAVALWLRCCATNQKVAGSIPDGVIGIFH